MAPSTSNEPSKSYRLHLTPFDVQNQDPSYYDNTAELIDVWETLRRTSTDAAQFQGGQGNVFSFRDDCIYFATIRLEQLNQTKGNNQKTALNGGTNTDLHMACAPIASQSLQRALDWQHREITPMYASSPLSSPNRVPASGPSIILAPTNYVADNGRVGRDSTRYRSRSPTWPAGAEGEGEELRLHPRDGREGMDATRVVNPNRDEDDPMTGNAASSSTSANAIWNATQGWNETMDEISAAPQVGLQMPATTGQLPSLPQTFRQPSNQLFPSITPLNTDETSPRDRGYILIGVVYAYIAPADMESCTVNIGVALKKAWRGQGYGSQAVEKVLEVVFGEMKMHRVHAGILDTEKVASLGTGELLSKWPAMAMFTKLGFTNEGYHRRDIKYPSTDEWVDSVHMAMLDTDWLCRDHFNKLNGNEPHTLWSELLLRHDRERTELLRHDKSTTKLKRTGSLETIRPPHTETSATRRDVSETELQIPTAETPAMTSAESTDYESASELVAEPVRSSPLDAEVARIMERLRAERPIRASRRRSHSSDDSDSDSPTHNLSAIFPRPPSRSRNSNILASGSNSSPPRSLHRTHLTPRARSASISTSEDESESSHDHGSGSRSLLRNTGSDAVQHESPSSKRRRVALESSPSPSPSPAPSSPPPASDHDLESDHETVASWDDLDASSESSLSLQSLSDED